MCFVSRVFRECNFSVQCINQNTVRAERDKGNSEQEFNTNFLKKKGPVIGERNLKPGS